MGESADGQRGELERSQFDPVGNSADAETENRLVEEVVETRDRDDGNQRCLPESAVHGRENHEHKIEEPDRRQILAEMKADPRATPNSRE